MSERYESGMAIRRQVLGAAHVDRAEAATTPLDAPFQDFITTGAWGSVWTREGLSHRDRSLVTLSLLAALGHWEEFEMHLNATRNTGATAEEVRETMLHVAVYAGVPAANKAMKLVKAVFAEAEG